MFGVQYVCCCESYHDQPQWFQETQVSCIFYETLAKLMGSLPVEKTTFLEMSL